MPESTSLAGVSVLVTRPREQADQLARLVFERGGVAERLPLIEIEAVKADRTLAARLAGVDRFDILVFVSRNAVLHGLALLERCGGRIGAGQVVAAVGRASARALEERGIPNVVSPRGRSSSEELLELAVLRDVAGRSALIFRGQEGREHLADTLRARGARVEYAPVYQRRAATADPDAVLRRWLSAPCPVLVLTSETAARSLAALAPPDLSERLFAAPVAVLSDRLKRYCRASGWRGPIEATEVTSDAGLVATVAALSRTCNERHVR